MGEEELRFGRDPGCDVVVPEATVSRKHARLFWDEGELVLEDLGSSGGTFVNGERVRRRAVVPGDLVRLGPRVEFVLEVEVASSQLEQVVSERGDGRTVHHLQVLLETARALNAATVLDEVLEIVLRTVVSVMGAEYGSIVLVGEDGRRSAVASYPGNGVERGWAERSSLLDTAMAQRRTVVAESSLSPTTSMMVRGVEQAAATPLLVARRPMGSATDASFVASLDVIGGILVERRFLGQRFEQEDLAVFESLAADAAVAIDSARLYREAREKAKIEHEMALARRIQTALLEQPPEVPFAEVFAFSDVARLVGGDLYHTALRQDGTLAATIGDVSGKGVAAALIMALVQGLLDVLHDLGQGIESVVPTLDRTLRRHNPGNRFLTMATALLGADGTLRMVNAGHCPAVVVRRDGRIDTIEAHGPVLGLLPQARWARGEVVLRQGETLVMYTDGILESFSPEGAEFGLAGVTRALAAAAGGSARDLGTALVEAAAAHRQGREADDDVTVLVVRFTGAGVTSSPVKETVT